MKRNFFKYISFVFKIKLKNLINEKKNLYLPQNKLLQRTNLINKCFKIYIILNFSFLDYNKITS